MNEVLFAQHLRDFNIDERELAFELSCQRMPGAVIDALKCGAIEKVTQAQINAVFTFLQKYTRQHYTTELMHKLCMTPTATASESKALDRLRNEEGYRVRDANGAVLYESNPRPAYLQRRAEILS